MRMNILNSTATDLSDELAVRKTVWKFKRGDVIFESQPYAVVVDENLTEKICHQCFRESADLLKCSACKFTRYCNARCQKQDWTQHHKEECKTLSLVDEMRKTKHVLMLETKNIGLVRLFGRVLRRFQKEKGTPFQAQEIALDRTRYMTSLLSHVPELRRDKTRELLTAIMRAFGYNNAQNPKLLPLGDEDILQLIGMVYVNSLEITRNLVTLGMGLYLGGSAVDHSCKPNTVICSKGTLLQFRANENMEISGIDGVTISYVNLQNDTATRKAFLQNYYFFNCSCTKCSDPNVAALEQENSFNNSLKRIQFEKELAEYTQQKSELVATKQYEELVALAEGFLEKYPEIHFPYNINYLKIQNTCFNSNRPSERMLEQGLKTLPGIEFYHGSNSTMLAVQLGKVEEVKMLLKKYSADSLSNLRKALTILECNEGKDSDWHKRCVEIWQKFCNDNNERSLEIFA